MVGCKCRRTAYSHCSEWELIDTWWDVNTFHSSAKTKRSYELIDTWWDVNLYRKVSITIEELELIDTWWDVNILSAEIDLPVQGGINRYMVGCKLYNR